MNKLAERLGGAPVTWGLAVLAAIDGAWIYSGLALNHDAASYLLMARALDDGKVLYETFPDYSMPANAWLGTLSLHIANATGISLATVHQSVLFLLTAAGAAVTGLIVSRACGLASFAGRVMPAVIMWLFLVIPGYDFGQRDVLFGVLAAPLVAIVAARHFGLAPRMNLSIAVAVLAAIGSSLKPQAGLPLIVLAAEELVARRGRIPAIARELWLLAGLLALYLIVVRLGYPTYFTQVLPGAVRIYAHMAVWIVSVLRSLILAAMVGIASALLLLIVLVHRLRASRSVPWGMAAAWAAFGVSLALMDVLQHQGLRYHSVPVLLYGLTSLGLFAAISVDDGLREWVGGFRLPAIGRVTVAVVGMLAMTVMAVRSYAPEGVSRQDALDDPVTRILQSLPPRTYVLAFQTGVLPISPLHAYSDVRWSGEFSQNHEIAAIMYDREEALASGRPRDPFFVALEQRVRHAAVRSLTTHPPAVVLVDVSRPLRWFEHYDKPFDLLTWFLQDPAFAAAWSPYVYVETVKSFGGVSVAVWRRRKE